MRSFWSVGLVVTSCALATTACAKSSESDQTYDYIVVGGGPSGIITSERLAEAGKSVLLLERGNGPTVSTGANESLSWNSSLTPIDVPGLSFDVGSTDLWNEYICTDTAGYAACVLGGGVTVNYMVFVHPPEHDFNDKWPQGWKWKDIKPAADRLYSRNPGTILPSADGKRYDQQLYSILSNFLSKLGWKSVDMISQPNEKHDVYSYPAWNVQDQKRAGPVRTYLPLAEKYENFSLRLGTKVTRLIRSGSILTGVEVQNDQGDVETISVAKNGRVILAAGALSTPRILFNSGIGPKAQIEIAAKGGIKVPSESDWINLPVGVGLKDHPIFSIVVKTNGTFNTLDGPAILNGTAVDDIKPYEENGSGVLTQGKHRLIFFTSNVASDNITRYYQGSCAPTDQGTVTITAYMTHGLTSTGILGLAVNQSTVFEKSPYLQTAGDREAATTFIQDMVNDITAPGTGLQLQQYIDTSQILGSLTSGIHWTSTTKMGKDDGRQNGTSVVDTNTKVYGTENLVCAISTSTLFACTKNIWSSLSLTAESILTFLLAISKLLLW